LLKKYRRPTTEQIKRGLSGNMCRCAAYNQIIDAIKLAAERIYPTAEEE